MVVQDALTGTLHEVSEGQVYESEVAEPETMGQAVFDGLGSPIGFFNPFKLISRPFKMIGRLFGGSRRRRAASPPPPDAGPPPEAPPDAGAGEVYDRFGNLLGEFFPLPRPPIPRLPIPLPRIGIGLSPRRRVWSPSLGRFLSMVWSPTQRRWVNAGPAPASGMPIAPPRAPWFRRIPPGWMRPLAPVTGANRLYLRCSTWPGPAGLTPVGAQQPGAPGMPGRRRRRGRRSRR